MARWLVASAAMGRPVTDDEPYPHVCRHRIDATHTQSGREVYLQRSACAACAHEHHHRRRPARHSRPGAADGRLT
ncbi:hypothetical protein E0H26_28160 [Micromonospora zingiberis]|uniref:Uncharacterized protein n=1 Tax=Micromonospora zingiberis TaxID=2053011 RepID=A0A4R0G135_9ACTN|nr:hypothetical protein [Micromonospora zingiberis]TCB89263.1 hypothetical protein E0H26_28160 [Micromonospora zingiberis]